MSIRLVSVMLAAAMAAGVLTGCGGSQDNAEGAEGGGRQSAILPEPAVGGGLAGGLADELTGEGPMFDIPDPVIDESTRLLAPDSVSMAAGIDVDEDELAVPPQRFYTRERALRHMSASADSAAYFTGILPRIVEEDLEYADRLINSKYPYFLVLDKQSMHAVLFDRHGHRVKAYPMTASRNFGNKHRRSDRRSPEGFFYARGVYDSSQWSIPGQEPDSAMHGVYGPRFISVTGQIGVHGSGPERDAAVGRRETQGCFRLRDADVLELASYVVTGMPIIINPADRDMAVNRDEGVEVAQITVGLSPADRTRNLSGSVSGLYPARPTQPDSANVERSDSIESHLVAPTDSVSARPEAKPDTITEPAPAVTNYPPAE